MHKASKIKKEGHASCGAADSIIKNIEGNVVGWEWAHNDQNLGKLQSCKKTLELHLNDGDQEILGHEVSSMKNMNAMDFKARLEHFNNHEEEMAGLSKEIKK